MTFVKLLKRVKKIRRKLLRGDFTKNEGEPIPGYQDSDLSNMMDETGLTRSELLKLYEIFESLGGNKETDVPLKVIEEFLARNSAVEPIDMEALDRCCKKADEDGEGDLSFDEFVRISCLRTV